MQDCAAPAARGDGAGRAGPSAEEAPGPNLTASDDDYAAAVGAKLRRVPLQALLPPPRPPPPHASFATA